MQMETGHKGREEAIAALFADTFKASEGPEEGTLIGDLVRDLMASTPEQDIRVFRAMDGGQLVGAVVFTPLTYAGDPLKVVLLSPMAVATDRQRQGIGKALISGALDALRIEGAEVAITYGDPAYYGRVGFVSITEAQAQAPLPLSFPHGWIGQSLTGGDMPDLQGKPTCVAAMNRPEIW